MASEPTTAPDIRKEIMVEMTRVAAEAMARGEDGLKAVEKMFPGVPVQIAVEAWMNAEESEVEAWWKSVERTIDGELIHRAIAQQSREG